MTPRLEDGDLADDDADARLHQARDALARTREFAQGRGDCIARHGRYGGEAREHEAGYAAARARDDDVAND